MKALGKRTKILLAITAAVVVIVVLTLAIFQPPLDQLFGTAVQVTMARITPADPTITYPGMQTQLTVNYTNCTWSSSDSSVVTLSPTTGKSTTANGAGPGQATVTVRCVVRVGKGTTTLVDTTTVKVGRYPFGQ